MKNRGGTRVCGNVVHGYRGKGRRLKNRHGCTRARPKNFLHPGILKFLGRCQEGEGPFVHRRITSNVLFIAERKSRIIDGQACFPFIGCVQLRMEYTWGRERREAKNEEAREGAPMCRWYTLRSYPRRIFHERTRLGGPVVPLLSNGPGRPLILH